MVREVTGGAQRCHHWRLFGQAGVLLMQRYKMEERFARKSANFFRPFQVGKFCPKSGETLCFRAFQQRSERVGNGSEDF